MTKIQDSSQNIGLNRSKSDPLVGAKNGCSLDTLAQLGKNDKNPPKNGAFLNDENDRKRYEKRAKAKFLTNSYLYKLIDLKSDLKDSYWSTYHCASYLESQSQDGNNKLICKYCNQRWCLVCNRIRIAKAINGYSKPLSNLEDKQFVTLTNKNCKGHELRDRIDLMLKMDSNNRCSMRKMGMKIKGVRKLECTYNPFTDDFNPHFHFIVDSKEKAESLINGWLKLNRKHNIKVSEKAQHFVECDNNSMMELFKYFTKIVSSKGDEKRHTTASALDAIFQAMKGKRVYQPIGGLRKIQVSEDVEDIRAETVSQSIANMGNWLWSINDWYAMESGGENLCGYQPSEYDKEYGKMIRNK